VLPLLAIALADNAFQDYQTFNDVEAIPPPADGSLYHLRIRKDLLRVPFFQIVSADGPTRKIHGASSFSNRTVNLGHGAGYEENIGVHDIRREVLVKADGKCFRTRCWQEAGIMAGECRKPVPSLIIEAHRRPEDGVGTFQHLQVGSIRLVQIKIIPWHTSTQPK